MTTRTAARNPAGSGQKRSRHLPRGRTLHLIDIENLLGSPFAGAPELTRAFAAYRSAIRVRAGDHVVIACNPALVVEAALAWRGTRVLSAGGPDGADLALIAEGDPHFVVTHYDRVVIGSGDGIFAGLVHELRQMGTAVCVVSRPESLSSTLGRLAGVTIALAA